MLAEHPTRRHSRDRRPAENDALIRADETVVDRTRLVLYAEQWKAFLAALDAPP